MTTQQTPATDVIRNVRRSPDGMKLVAQDPWTGDWMFVFGRPEHWPANSRVLRTDVADWEPLHSDSDATDNGFAALRSDLDEARADAAANAATLDYVSSSLTILLENYEQVPEDLPDTLDRIKLLTDSLAWLHAEAKHQLGEAQKEISDLRDRARRVRENDHIGYLDHFNKLVKALGQHADPSARSLHQLIDRDVTDLVEAFDTIETELIEWRTGQRTADTNAEQWAQVNAMLDETLATVRQLASHATEDGQREQLRGELPTGGDLCPVGVGGGPDGDDYAPCNATAAPSLEVCADHADGPVTETAVGPHSLRADQ